MAIIIPHRFLHRLTSTEGMDKVNVIIIGTFNPGLPEINQLSSDELTHFSTIEQSKRFQRFSQVMNFYDRPQNRFWKIMDYLNTPQFYASTDLKKRNEQGLKFYSNMRDRQQVFQRQEEFRKRMGILITDIVQLIKPNSFDKIYENFPDTAIENASPVWNDEAIGVVIEKYKPAKVLVNFNPESANIPNISRRINNLKSSFRYTRFIALPSTSGAAALTYDELAGSWGMHF
jgi:G:T/U-mismatch repair DNA glycosylase